MPIIPVRDVGQYGVLTDRPAHEIPANAWTKLRNVRAKDGYVERIGGETEVLNTGTQITAPWNIFYCPAVNGTPYWIYGGSDKVGVADSNDHYDITPAAVTFTASDLERWTGTWLNGVFIINNPSDECQAWETIDPTTPVELVEMSAVTSTEFQTDWRFNSMRGFKQILIGLGFNDGSTYYPTTVKWSGPASPGTVPIEWDSANLNNISGEYPLSDTPGYVIDGMQLGNRFIICKSDATYVATFAQGASALAFNHIDLKSGVMAKHCMQEYQAGKMIILNQNADVMITDGITVRSVLSKKLRAQMLATVDVDRTHQAFIQVNPFKEEVWICYPIAGEIQDQAGEALIWNYADNTFTYMDLEALTHLSFGKVSDESTVPFIDDADDFIDDADILIDGGGLSGNNSFIACSHVRAAILELDRGALIGGNPYTCTMERLGLAIVGQNRDGSERVDHNQVKMCSGLWPVVETSGVSLTMNISVGAQERRDGAMTWDGPIVFDPEADQMLDFLMEGIYIAVRLTCTATAAWKLHGYGISIDVVGEQL